MARALAAAARSLEAEADRWSLWIPVLFACGVLGYFALANELDPILAVSLLIAALGLALATRGTALGLAIGGAALAFAGGFADAKLRTEMTRAPVLAKELHNVTVKGFVEAFERREKRRVRITLRVISLGALAPEATPYRVRASLSEKAGKAATGDAVAVKATLRPLPEPVMPNGFDFGRTAWFARLGGTGYATGAIEPLTLDQVAPLDLRLWAAIDRVRDEINVRIHAALPGERGEIAAALITGERAGISDEVNQAMRNSGLFHILSISGLHMVIMAGTVLWLVRALLALVPALALSFPIRKWAAACALAAVLGYLLLSGASVPAVRSWVMMSIVLLAVLLDRPALTMRNVALAALLILVCEPETVFDPSFQISFTAVIGLVALFESRPGRSEASAAGVSLFWRLVHKLRAIIAGDALSTLVATVAVSPFAVYHFHRASYYGVFTNLLALPLVSLIIMPMALAALVAMPFGLEAWPLQAMGVGIDLLVDVGKWVASWPGAVSVLPAIPAHALALMVLGGLWLCLWRTRWRALGLMIAACGLALTAGGTRPDVLIERDGHNVALRAEDGTLALPPATVANYSVDNWLLADGDERDAETAAIGSSFHCDLLGCIGMVKGKTIAIVRHPAALEEDCRSADIVIVPFTVGKGCGAARVVVDRKMLWSEGAYASTSKGCRSAAKAWPRRGGIAPGCRTGRW